ncbi:hypothetical protein [Puia dinghuensis]|uniref:Outer membrane protein beta-barrel domain-containing protein n=1 Tax=Puia dinghuensis TaxID=1792502 RepID=A0A8J2UHN0_9BACT|nr:hypothetical protein [Puia dinghuensis]GGB18212.1 hypothetical protein GCM10011511_47550 [Puia dinghuensis]
MNKTLLTVLLLPFLSITISHAQSRNAVPDLSPDKVTLGIGGGQDYGGLGLNLTVYPQKNIGLFAAGGYALAGFGYNVGVKLRLLPNEGVSKVRPFLAAMYGYNAAIAVSDASQYNKLFYGPTVGGGLDIGSLFMHKGYISLAIWVPIRGDDVDNYINNLKTNYGVAFNNHLLPISFSVGYKFILD